MNVSERKIGKSKELGLSMVSYGSVCAAFQLYERGFKYLRAALELRREIGDVWGEAHSLEHLSYFYLWKGDFDQCVAKSREGAETFKRIGDFKQYIFALHPQFYGYHFQGDYAKTKVICDQFYESASKAKDHNSICIAHTLYGFYYLHTGDFGLAKFYSEENYRLSAQFHDSYGHCAAGILLGISCYMAGELPQAIRYLEEARDFYEKNQYVKLLVALIFTALAEVYIADYLLNGYSLAAHERWQYRNKIKALCKKALAETKPWKINYGGALLVQAKYFHLVGKLQRAEAYFHQGIAHCNAYNLKYDLALSHYEYGLFLKQQNRTGEAEQHWTQGYALFKEMGSQHYQKKIAVLLGSAEENSGSEQRLSQEIRYSSRLASIISLSRNISSILNMELLLEKVMNTALEISGAQNGYLLIRNHTTGQLETLVQKTNGGRNARSESIICEVAEKGEAVMVSNAAKEENCAPDQSGMANDVKSILCVPIKYNEEIIGICYLDNQLSSAVFTQEDIEVLNLVMTQAAISIENARLYKLAILDGLTELITRKHFMQLLEQEIKCSKRYQRVFSLLMLDIDHFKRINDTYGHQAGDLVLVSLAKVANDCFRMADMIGRYGGEEFIVALPETNLDGALVAAARFQAALRNMGLELKGDKLGITVSIGVAAFPEHGADMEGLISAADTALYQSKRNGGDRITVVQPTITKVPVATK